MGHNLVSEIQFSVNMIKGKWQLQPMFYQT